MTEQHLKWHSDILGQETEMLVFGEKGYPVILFPTSMGRYFQTRDFKLIESAKYFLEEGLVKIYCVDSIDEASWYNKNVHPSIRARNHVIYDSFLKNEIAPKALQETGMKKLATAGCSFGGYHAMNFAFRYPEITGYLFSMGGAFDIKPQVDGYYDDNVYFNNPPDYLAGLENSFLKEMGIVLGTGDQDMCKEANINISNILNKKNISHWLDIRTGEEGIHDWPAWRAMFPHYLSLIGNAIHESRNTMPDTLNSNHNIKAT